MASHGVAQFIRAARTEEQRQQDLEKIHRYRQIEGSIRSQASQGVHDTALFQLTSKLLRLNPEYYTIWNVRRRCLISGLLSRRSASSSPSRELPSTSPSATTRTLHAASSLSSSAAIPQDRSSPTTGQTGTTADVDEGKESKEVESDAGILQSELAFTVPLLLEFPKCYWLWNYRKWILEQAILRLPTSTATSIWEAELALDSKMLTKDRRNFHAWGYRRHLVAKLETPSLRGRSMAEDEFAYTTKMIRVDLSNFSAWHNRSRLILRLLQERGADDEARSAFLEEELNQVREALNVGPEDQSLWYYHRYLILQLVDRTGKSTIAPGLTIKARVSYVEREIDDIKDFLEDYEDIKWIYEALLEYTLALRQLNHTGLSNGECNQQDNIQNWLAKLRKLDPMQAGRWDDVEQRLRSRREAIESDQ
ncbi:hypothetical protein F5X99DRAFT_66507 [Biscogniauxia marginata]|nr:hypothetical protein F5X99DRAFT_66507 [Biscogniauxia marginata]